MAVRLLDLGFFRIGGEEYAEENDTFGLATMQNAWCPRLSARMRAHLRLSGEEWCPAGANRHRRRRLPGGQRSLSAGVAGGDELLAYKRDGRWCDVTSAAINDLIRELTGGPYSAKDFRTWNATVLAAVSLAVSAEVARSAAGRKRAKSLAVRDVARYLGNTPAICRALPASISGSSTASTPVSPLPARSSMWEATGPVAPTSRLPTRLTPRCSGCSKAARQSVR